MNLILSQLILLLNFVSFLDIGFVLRKDDPVSLKEIILSIQAKASTIKKEETE